MFALKLLLLLCAPCLSVAQECMSQFRKPYDSVTCFERLSESKFSTNDFALSSPDETLLLAEIPTNLTIVATVKPRDTRDEYVFEGVAVVPAHHKGGLQGLRGGTYCNAANLDQGKPNKISPRVLRAFERAITWSSCDTVDVNNVSADALEATYLGNFFGDSCRNGFWTYDKTLDARLKTNYPHLCKRCNSPVSCDLNYLAPGLDYKPLECLKKAGNNAVAYTSWADVKKSFSVTYSNPDTQASSYALLCKDGSTVPLVDSLNKESAPCVFARQSWWTIVAHVDKAENVTKLLKYNQANHATAIREITGINDFQLFYKKVSAADFTKTIRNDNGPALGSCLKPFRWCVDSPKALRKCQWLSGATRALGLQPTFECEERANVRQCFRAISGNKPTADLVVSSTNHGFEARKWYNLVPLKFVQGNERRVAAVIYNSFVAELRNDGEDTTREGAPVCFPHIGSLGWLAYLRQMSKHGRLGTPDVTCGLGKWFESSGACVPGADQLANRDLRPNYDGESLCRLCEATNKTAYNDLKCSDDTKYNLYYGDQGVLECLKGVDRSNTRRGWLETDAIDWTDFYIDQSRIKAYGRNGLRCNTKGLDLGDCLVAIAPTAEILTRRMDTVAIGVLLDNIHAFFNVNGTARKGPINFHLNMAFDETFNLVFPDNTKGFLEPIANSPYSAVRDYIDLLNHTQVCLQRSAGAPKEYPIVLAVVAVLMALFIH